MISSVFCMQAVTNCLFSLEILRDNPNKGSKGACDLLANCQLSYMVKLLQPGPKSMEPQIKVLELNPCLGLRFTSIS